MPLRVCLASLQAVRRLGHVELVLADNGPVLVLRHLDPLSAGDRQNWNSFRISISWRCFSPLTASTPNR